MRIWVGAVVVWLSSCTCGPATSSVTPSAKATDGTVDFGDSTVPTVALVALGNRALLLSNDFDFVAAVSDGTAERSTMLPRVDGFRFAGYESSVAVQAEHAFIIVDTADGGTRVWRTDGTVEGSRLIDLPTRPLTVSAIGSRLVLQGGQATSGSTAPVYAYQPSDGGLELLLEHGGAKRARLRATLGGRGLFTMQLGTDGGWSTVITDGTASGTRVLDGHPLPFRAGDLGPFVDQGTHAWFFAADGLWSTDGTVEGVTHHSDEVGEALVEGGGGSVLSISRLDMRRCTLDGGCEDAGRLTNLFGRSFPLRTSEGRLFSEAPFGGFRLRFGERVLFESDAGHGIAASGPAVVVADGGTLITVDQTDGLLIIDLDGGRMVATGIASSAALPFGGRILSTNGGGFTSVDPHDGTGTRLAAPFARQFGRGTRLGAKLVYDDRVAGARLRCFDTATSTIETVFDGGVFGLEHVDGFVAGHFNDPRKLLVTDGTPGGTTILDGVPFTPMPLEISNGVAIIASVISSSITTMPLDGGTVSVRPFPRRIRELHRLPSSMVIGLIEEERRTEVVKWDPTTHDFSSTIGTFPEGVSRGQVVGQGLLVIGTSSTSSWLFIDGEVRRPFPDEKTPWHLDGDAASCRYEVVLRSGVRLPVADSPQHGCDYRFGPAKRGEVIALGGPDGLLVVNPIDGGVWRADDVHARTHVPDLVGPDAGFYFTRERADFTRGVWFYEHATGRVSAVAGTESLRDATEFTTVDGHTLFWGLEPLGWRLWVATP